MALVFSVCLFVLAFSFVGYLVKIQWDKLAKEIQEIGSLRAKMHDHLEAEKRRVAEQAEKDKLSEPVDAANRIIQE